MGGTVAVFWLFSTTTFLLSTMVLQHETRQEGLWLQGTVSLNCFDEYGKTMVAQLYIYNRAWHGNHPVVRLQLSLTWDLEDFEEVEEVYRESCDGLMGLEDLLRRREAATIPRIEGNVRNGTVMARDNGDTIVCKYVVAFANLEVSGSMLEWLVIHQNVAHVGNNNHSCAIPLEHCKYASVCYISSGCDARLKAIMACGQTPHHCLCLCCWHSVFAGAGFIINHKILVAKGCPENAIMNSNWIRVHVAVKKIWPWIPNESMRMMMIVAWSNAYHHQIVGLSLNYVGGIHVQVVRRKCFHCSRGWNCHHCWRSFCVTAAQ